LDIAPSPSPGKEPKNPGGLKGGNARVKKLTPRQRSMAAARPPRPGGAIGKMSIFGRFW
jgi:hypothetical protein